jgi:hypothetical protein
MKNSKLDPKNRKMSLTSELIILNAAMEKEQKKESILGLSFTSLDKAFSFSKFVIKNVLFSRF